MSWAARIPKFFHRPQNVCRPGDGAFRLRRLHESLNHYQWDHLLDAMQTLDCCIIILYLVSIGALVSERAVTACMHFASPQSPLEQRCSGAVQTAICIVPLSLQTASTEMLFSKRSIGTRSTNPSHQMHAEREGSARAYVLPLSTAYISASIICVSSNCPVTAVQPSGLPHLPSNLTGLISSKSIHAKCSQAFPHSQCYRRCRYSMHVKVT